MLNLKSIIDILRTKVTFNQKNCVFFAKSAQIYDYRLYQAIWKIIGVSNHAETVSYLAIMQSSLFNNIIIIVFSKF